MADVSAQVVFQGASNLPEDRFINTFHFSSGEPYASHSAAIDTALGNAFTVVSTFRPVGSYLSQYVLRPFQVKTYNMADLQPRQPTTYDHTLPAVATTQTYDLPEQVAAVATFYAAPPITRRRRGRIYLGPLHGSAQSDAGASTPSRLDVQFIADINAAMQSLVTANIGWSVYSRVDAAYYPIVAGYTNNGLDTQRRRSAAPTSRTTWPA